MSNAQNILASLRSLIPNVKTVKSVSASRNKRDTLEQARKKVIEKLQKNSAIRRGIATDEKVDPVYKEQGDGCFGVGIKYGNRYLQDAIAGGTFVPDVEPDQLPAVLDLLVEQVEKGWYDDAIEKIRKDNVAARNRSKN